MDCLFFFSSRRRHTRYWRDWSSDVCSSDLGQEPLLPSIPSRVIGRDDALDDLVVKPRGEMGGEGVLIWRDADEGTRARVREQIAAQPGGWIGQELVQLSVHPSVVEGRLEPRHVDLRPYALLSESGVRVLPAATSRVA